jgi:hypothetical protein
MVELLKGTAGLGNLQQSMFWYSLPSYFHSFSIQFFISSFQIYFSGTRSEPSDRFKFQVDHSTNGYYTVMMENRLVCKI